MTVLLIVLLIALASVLLPTATGSAGVGLFSGIQDRDAQRAHDELAFRVR